MADHDFTRPYSPPKAADSEAGTNGFRIIPLDTAFSVKEVLSTGWKAFKENIGTGTGGVLIAFLAMMGASFIASFLVGLPLQMALTAMAGELSEEYIMIVALLTGLLQNIPAYAIAFPVTAGLMIFGVQLARQAKGQALRPDISVIFSGFPKFVTVIGIGFLRDVLLVYILMIPFFVLMFQTMSSHDVFSPGNSGFGSFPGEILISMVILIPAFFVITYVMIRFSYAYQVALEFNTGVIDSLRVSWRMTAGLTVLLKIIGYGLVNSVILFISFLLCIVPSVFAFVWILAAHGAVYDELLKRVLITEKQV